MTTATTRPRTESLPESRVPEPAANHPAGREAQARVLEQAASFTDDQWTQLALAVDKNGKLVKPTSARVAARCAVAHLDAALEAAGPNFPEGEILEAVLAELPADTNCPATWNDRPGRTPEEVRQLFRRAAARLRSQAQLEREIESRDEPLTTAV